MSEHNHHGHGGAIGLALFVAAIAFAFGPRAARVVTAVLLAGAGVAGLFFLYVVFRVVTGTV